MSVSCAVEGSPWRLQRPPPPATQRFLGSSQVGAEVQATLGMTGSLSPPPWGCLEQQGHRDAASAGPWAGHAGLQAPGLAICTGASAQAPAGLLGLLDLPGGCTLPPLLPGRPPWARRACLACGSCCPPPGLAHGSADPGRPRVTGSAPRPRSPHRGSLASPHPRSSTPVTLGERSAPNHPWVSGVRRRRFQGSDKAQRWVAGSSSHRGGPGPAAAAKATTADSSNGNLFSWILAQSPKSR